MTMNDAEWNKCDAPEPLLRWLQVLSRIGSTQAGRRKQRLFVCACARRTIRFLPDPRALQVLAVAERFADGQADKAERTEAFATAKALVKDLRGQPASCRLTARVVAATVRAGNDVGGTIEVAELAVNAVALEGMAGGPHESGDLAAAGAERRAQADLVRELWGIGYRPYMKKYPPHLVSLAESINAGDHALYPVLVDALADLEFPEAAAHCRQPNHIKGCDVVDTILGYM
jgi:hypothetical protein